MLSSAEKQGRRETLLEGVLIFFIFFKIFDSDWNAVNEECIEKSSLLLELGRLLEIIVCHPVFIAALGPSLPERH